MTPEQQARCEALLEAALDRDPASWSPWLDTECADDPLVRREVERLLSLQGHVPDGFLVPPSLGWEGPNVRPGSRLGRYHIVEHIGSGGMGLVFKAHDPAIDRFVAIKLLHTVAGNPRARERFVSEVQMLGRIRHEHVVQVFDVGTADGVPYLVMELLEGETLASAIAGGRTGSLQQQLTTARQIAAALAQVHAAGIVHRDIKPANVFVQQSGRVTLMDFGISRPEAHQTQSNVLVGTLAYIAPEQVKGQAATVASDVYAYAVVLYELFTRQKPFDGTTAELLYSVAHDSLPLEPLVAAGVPPAVIAAIVRATAKEPTERPTLLEVDAVLAAEEAGAEPPILPRRDEHRRAQASRLTAKGTRAIRVGRLAAILGILLVLAYFSRVSVKAEDSIAVMPFANIENDSALDYVAEGLAESLTNTLTRLRSLRVVARSTAFSLKGREFQDIRKLGQDLDVRAIVTGRVSRLADDRVRVQADLVDVRSGAQLWGNQYEGRSEDLLRIHDDVVKNVTERLQVDDSPAARQKEAPSPTSSPNAYDLYLRGRFALSRATVADIQRAIDLFQQALAVDPNYAQAYAGLADSYIGLSGMYLQPRDAMLKAKAAVARALALDPQLPEAHLSHAVVLAFYDFDWTGSARELKRAIELNPNDASIRLWYAWNLVLTGRGQEGIAEASRARELDPLSSYIETGLAQMYYCSGLPSEAIRRLRNVIATDPRFFSGHYYLGVAYIADGRYPEAIEALRAAQRLEPQSPQPIGYLVYALAMNGQREAARAELERLEAMSRARYVSGFVLAVASAGLDEREDAVRWLLKAYEDRDDMLSIAAVERALTNVRADNRVAALLARIGLAPR